jgi:hypothetical protein
MGAGDYPAGVGPCGHDPIVTDQSRVFVTPEALKYDGATKAFIQDATTGKLEACHPVDQKMAFGLLFRRGSIKGDIRIGNTFHEIQSVRNADIQQQLWDRARTAMPVSDVLLAGDAEILRIGYEERPHGGLTIVVEYVNKRLKNSNPRRVDYRIES